MPSRRKNCESYGSFRKNLERARAFLRIFDIDRTSGRPSRDENELLRGAVVFAIGALDAFLHDLVLEIVPRFGGDRGAVRDALRVIAKDDPGLALRMQLAPDSTSRTDEFRAALNDWLESKSFQGPQRVVTALSYIGSSLIWEDFDEASGVNAASRLDHFTRMRHDVVHRGRKPRIVRQDAQQCVDLVGAMAGAINSDVVRNYNEHSGT